MKLKPIALLDLPTVRNRLDPGSMALDDFRRSWGGELIFDAVAGTTAAVASYLDKPRVMRERLRARGQSRKREATVTRMTGYRASGAIVLLAAGPVMAGPSMLGLWARGDGKAVVRIEPCGANLCAINTWVRAGTKNEKAGDKLILTVSPSGPSVMTGQAFDPQRDLTYRMRIEVGDRTMSSRGCILAGLLCRSMSWSRLSSASQ